MDLNCEKNVKNMFTVNYLKLNCTVFVSICNVPIIRAVTGRGEDAARYLLQEPSKIRVPVLSVMINWRIPWL